MLTKPDLQDETIITCLEEDFGLSVDQVSFLPIGADSKAAVYRVEVDQGTPYLLKLRAGILNETSLSLAKFLGDQGIETIITPLATQGGQLWTALGGYQVALYPFIEGRNGYEAALSERHWNALGAALRSIHQAKLTLELAGRIRREDYSPRWRDMVKAFLGQVKEHDPDDPIAKRTAAFLMKEHDEILYLVARAEQLALALQAGSSNFILCHADLHAGNVLVAGSGGFYIVDWDDAILAPKEHDLMFIGGGLMGGWYPPREEESLFYRAYGQTSVDPAGLAYYRYERIIEDIAVICQQIFSAAGSVEDREQSFGWLTSNFLPGHTIELAKDADTAAY